METDVPTQDRAEQEEVKTSWKLENWRMVDGGWWMVDRGQRRRIADVREGSGLCTLDTAGTGRDGHARGCDRLRWTGMGSLR